MNKRCACSIALAKLFNNKDCYHCHRSQCGEPADNESRPAGAPVTAAEHRNDSNQLERRQRDCHDGREHSSNRFCQLPRALGNWVIVFGAAGASQSKNGYHVA